jgi:hypothetical protein
MLDMLRRCTEVARIEGDHIRTISGRRSKIEGIPIFGGLGCTVQNSN